MKKLSMLAVFLLIFVNRVSAVSFQEDHDTRFQKNPSGLSLTISTEKDTYRIGEIIPVTLTFTNKSETAYVVSVKNYDRSGRIQDAVFVVDGSPTGFVDPLDIYFARGVFGGGLSSDRKLGEYSQVFNLNEWIRFDVPGEYRFFCTSTLVETQVGHGLIPMCSQVLKVKIERDRRFMNETFRKSREDLKSSDDKIKQQAVQALRFLATPEAAEVLVPFIGNENNQLAIEASFGIIGCRNRPAARRTLEKLMEDPAIAVNRRYIDTLTLLSIPQEELLIKWDPSNEELNKKMSQVVSEKLKDARKKNLEKLAGLLSKKKGRALAVGADLLLAEGVDTPGVRQKAAESFLNLTENEQRNLLGYQWEKIRCEEFVPVLEEILKRPYKNEDWRDPRLFSFALLRYQEYRPEKARQIIIEDIKRSHPFFSGSVLCSLPDKILPDVEATLVANMNSESDLYKIFGLIERYASANILPEVTRFYEQKMGLWACDVEYSFQRYWIKQDRRNGLEALKRAMQFRERTGCYTRLLGNVLPDYYGQDAEKLAVSYLKDPDPHVVIDAVRLLSKKGSDSCIDSLLQTLSMLNSENKTPVAPRFGGFSEADAYREIINCLLETRRWTLTKEQQEKLGKYL